MNICFLGHGDSIHTRQWVRYFRDRGHRVSVISLTPAESEPGVELYILKHNWRVSYERTNWHYLLKLPELSKIVRYIRPDILNAHFLSSYGLLGALIRPAACPLVISLHGSDILIIPRRSPAHNLAARFALRRADMLTSVAQHMTQVLPEYIGPDKPILTLQYGVDTTFFFPPSKLLARDPICFSNRAMVPVTNLETVVCAASILKKQQSPIHIHLAGYGELSSSLKQKVADLELGDRVLFLGRIVHEQMPTFLRLAAIYVSMSHSDGASLALLEAMACGTFPVVSDIPANREWIKDGVNGYLVPCDAPEQLACRLNDAFNRPKLRQEAAELNWSVIRDKGDYHKNMGIIESAFMSLVK